MATRSDNNKQFRCSFCNKTQDQVRKLVAGPKGVYICDECIEDAQKSWKTSLKILMKTHRKSI